MTTEREYPYASFLRRQRSQASPGTFFVTEYVSPIKPVLTGRLAEVICETWAYYARRNMIHLRAFVVMPDHWHVLLHTGEFGTLPAKMQVVDRRIRARTKEGLQTLQCAWPEGYQHIRVKSLRQFEYIRTRIEENPVRAGLIETAADWPFSTAHSRYAKLVSQAWPWRFEKDD